MIYVKKTNVEENDFIALLEKSKGFVLDFLSKSKDISPLYFETVVYEQAQKAARGTTFEGAIKQTGAHAFPDIIANKYFGIEVKMTTSDHWISTGNSILESSRVEDVERIYIMFGKFGGKMDVRYRLYQECLPEISVTHSPRYRINMDLPIGKSIFDKIGIDYDTLRNDDNTIQKIKEYYRSQLKDGEELWWIDQENGDRSVSPIIRPFRSLSKEEKENFIVEAMILFPEMFGNSNNKFERSAAYLIAEYNAVSANLRDLFTAGGKVAMEISGKKVLLPQVAYRLFNKSRKIKNTIDKIDSKILSYYWRSDNIESDRLSQWKKILDKNFILVNSDILASDIFDYALYEDDEKLS